MVTLLKSELVKNTLKRVKIALKMSENHSKQRTEPKASQNHSENVNFTFCFRTHIGTARNKRPVPQ